MAISSTALANIIIGYGTPRLGSCITTDFLQELVGLLTIQVSESDATSVAMKASSTAGNLSFVDGDGGIFTPAGQFTTETKVFTGADLIFVAPTGFNASTALISFFAEYASGETGVEVKKEPTGTAFIRPTVEIVSRTSSAVTLTVKNNSEDCSVTLQLFQPAIPIT